MNANELTLSKLTSGIHSLQVRTKKNTGQGWSHPETFIIEIGKPFWLDINFILFVIMLAIVISLVSYGVGIYFMNQRRRHLEELIHKRTQQLQIANQELTVRNTELDRFVYSASHDLSAPLKSIRGLINITRMEKPESNTLSYLNMMEQTVKKLEHFISEVVSYSRNVRMPVKVEEINFSELVNALLEDHQFAPDFGLIHFQVEHKTTSTVCLDSMRLKIILNNLISNAIKFHRPVEEVEPRVTIQLAEAEADWVLTVRDNGKGIPKDHIANIFTMFYRAHETSAGSGLGLYIMKEAVEKMSGRISVQSEVGQGTTFTIFLPKSPIVAQNS
jgi:Signal transduction histidine kinase